MNAVAIHGFRCPLPAGWEVVGTWGGWRKGHLVVAEGRQPRLSVTWRRHQAAPDLVRTLRGAGKRLERSHAAGTLVAHEAVGDDGRLGRWDSDGGAFHAATRYFPTAGLTLVVRQLAIGGSAIVRDAITGCTGWSEDAAWPWQIYDLDLTLPPQWRLEGIQQLVGLVRAVWFHLPPGAASPDQVLVMRRLACASRLLGNRTLGAWLRAGLATGEQVEHEHKTDGVVHMHGTAPASNWWRRWRGQRDERDFHAWIETPRDRLVMQEWKGRGPALPCLRPSADPQAGAPEPCRPVSA